MKILKHVQLGTHHESHTEDFAIYKDIGEDRILLAVMDGCTMGKESHFVSTLIGKLLRKIAHEEYYKEYAVQTKLDLEELLESVVIQLLVDLKRLKVDLNLDKYELLSTVVLSIIDGKEKTAVCLIIGDGLVVINGTYHDFDQDNTPDYIGYHLEEDPKEYFQGLSQKVIATKVVDVSISTDGVYTFSSFDINAYPTISEEAILNRLFINTMELNNERALEKAVLQLEAEFGLKPTDDLGIVRAHLG